MGSYYGLGLGLGGTPFPIRGSHIALGGLIDQFPNAAAAYSLRALRNNAGNVIRVRRDSDNDERDFTASQITSGELVNWVNTEVTLPLDLRELESDGRTGSVIPAAAAYSLRNLSADGTEVEPEGDTVSAPEGNYVVQVRRETDDSLKSFTADGITFGEMLAWVKALDTSSSAWVSKWYDQSGNDRHATQTSTGSQPRIVNDGVLETESGNPAIQFDATNDYLTADSLASTFSGTNKACSTFIKHGDIVDNTNFEQFYSFSNSSSVGGHDAGDLLQSLSKSNATGRPYGFYINDGSVILTTSATSSLGANKLLTLVGNRSSDSVFSNGSATSISGFDSTGDALTFDQFSIGVSRRGTNLTNYFSGKMAEFIIYQSDRSEDRAALESNIGDHYGISGPIYPNNVSGFVETWYDQSGNGNDATQTTTSLQPKIVDDGSLVTSNGLASLEFDVTGTLLTADSVASLFSGTDRTWAHFSVSEFKTAAGGPIVASLGRSSSNTPLIYTGVSASLKQRFFGRDDSSSVFDISSDPISAETQYLSYGTTNGAAQSQFVNGDAAGTATVDTGAMTLNRFGIGALRRVNNTNYHDGKISEFVLYNSDQSSNRTAIEDNINAHYDIYS